jgi:predicted dehydrogenase/threonine dehydrogenase-like Zn-dependent dehydrogenase
MKQIVQNFRTGELKIDNVPAPAVRRGGLLVGNECSLVSAGTERSTVSTAKKNLLGKAMARPDQVRKVIDRIKKDGLTQAWKMASARLDTPVALGYSCAGVVREVGSDAGGFAVGDRVACAGQNYASHAEIVYVPKNLCVKIPDGVEFEEAAFVTLGAIALQGVRQAEPRLGEIVTVIGLGLLGQLTVQMLKANGCRVVASDPDPRKRELAAKFGVDHAVAPDELPAACMALSSGFGADAVIITASTRDNGPVETAGEIARKKGRVVVVGAVGMTIPREPYYMKELELRLSTSYGPGRYDPAYEDKGHDYPYGYVRWSEQRNMQAFLALVQQRKVDVRTLITHRYAIGEAEDAYRLMMENREPYLGIMISYPSAAQADARRVIPIGATRATADIQLGVIGAGNHVKDMLLPQVVRHRDVVLRAVCTGTGVNARHLGNKLGAEYCSSDYREVLADASVNTVLIGTRHNLHGRMVIEALRAGKHVFVEKPLCLTATELDEIETLVGAMKDPPVLMVGHNRRFSPHAARAREFFAGRHDPLVMLYRVNAGAIPGEHWIQDPQVGGGRIVGEACHFIDYMQAVCSGQVRSVRGNRIARHSSGITDDQSVFSFEFADGSVGTLVYTAGGDTRLSKERFEAFGGGRALVMDDFLRSEFYASGKLTRYTTRNRDKGFAAEMALFIQAVQSGTPAVSFADTAAVARASILAARSLETSERYRIP